MKKSRVNPKNISYKEAVRTAEKHGFVVFQGSKHAKVKSADGSFITMIPRHESINPKTARSIFKAMKDFGAKIDVV